MKPRRFVVEKKETVEELLVDIEVQLMDANIMKAMEMLHDENVAYSDEEQGYLQDIAGIPFAKVDDNSKGET